MITGNEALKAIEAGWFLRKPGYTIGKGSYFADGPFPGCLRGGAFEDEWIAWCDWEKASFEDIVKSSGYYPTYSTMGFTSLEKSPYIDDLIKHEHHMLAWMLNSDYSAEDFKNSMKANKIWGEYFDSHKDL